MRILSVFNAGADTDRFLVQDSTGAVKFRTGAEVASDIGAAVGYVDKVKHEVKLGENIAKGQAVYVTSADGTNMIVSKASNASEATSSKTLGLLETGGTTNAKVFVITEGLLSGLNTSTATIGDPVWLGVNGDLIYGLVNKPYAPAHLVFIGIVTRVNTNNGEIFVKVQNGFELKEIHDVQITGTPVDKAVIQYDTASGLWKNSTLAGVTASTGTAGQVAYFTGATTQAGSNNLFWDNINGRLGIGTNVPLNALNVIGRIEVSGSGGISGNGLTLGYLASTYGYIQTFGSVPMILNGAGNNVIIGVWPGSDNGNKLQVLGNAFIKGSGNTSATTGLTVQNSDAANLFRVRNDGATLFGSFAENGRIYPSDTNGNISINGPSLTIEVNNTGSGAFFLRGGTQVLTGGTLSMLNVTRTFAPTSGVATFTTAVLNPVINQVGATGITRGLYVNPTLTAAADWRSIEWSNNTGWGLYGTGTAANHLAGSLSVGTTTNNTGYITNYSTIPVLALQNPTTGTGAADGFQLSISGSLAYIWQYENAAMLFGTNATERMRLDASGNLGLGTTSPSQKLTIYGGNALGQIKVGNADNANWEFGRDNSVTGDFILTNNIGGTAVEALRVKQSTTRVLIGGAGDTGEKLQVTGVAKISAGGTLHTARFEHTSNDGGINVRNNAAIAANRSSQLRLMLGTTEFGASDVTYQLVNIGTSTTASDFLLQYYNGSTYSERLRVTSTGNFAVDTNTLFVDATANRVGIGTTNPSYTFHAISADGTIGAFRNSGAALGQLLVGNTAGDMILRILATGDSLIYSDTAKYLAFGSNGGTERMRIDTAGNVGIGVTAPNVRLDVNGSLDLRNAFQGYARLQPSAGNTSQARLSIRLKPVDTAEVTLGSFTQDGSFGLGGNITDIISMAGAYFSVASTGRARLNSYGAGTFTGTVAYNLAVDASGNVIETAGGVVDGSGTANYVPKWQDANTLTNSLIFDNGTNVGIGTATPGFKLDVVSSAGYNTIIGRGASGSYFETYTIAGVRHASFGSEAGGDVYLGSRSNNPLIFITNNTEQMRLSASGNLGIGTSSPTYRLDVLGSTLTEPSASPVDDYTARFKRTYVNNNASVNSRRYNIWSEVRYDGNQAYTNTASIYTYVLYNNTNASSIAYGNAVLIEVNAGSVASSLFGTQSAINLAGTIANATLFRGYLLNYTTGTTTNAKIYQAQSEGAVGTITNLYGFMAESSLTNGTNNYGFYGNIYAATGANRWNLYMAGTADNYLAGSLGIGIAALGGYNLRINKAITGGAYPFSFAVSGAVQSDVTQIATYVHAISSTQAATFTLPQIILFNAEQGTFGANSVVTAQTGFNVTNLSGATTNIGFSGNLSSGSGKWNLYMGGTANNYMAGSLGIGSTSLTGINLNLGKTITGATTAYGILQQGTIQTDVTSAAYGFRNLLNTAASVSLSGYSHIRLGQSTIGAGTAITTHTGIEINDLTTGTNIYAISSSVSAGTNKWNAYFSGTANNYLAGNILVGEPRVAGAAWQRYAVVGNISADKVILGYLASATNGAVVGSNNGNLNAWARLNIAGSDILFRIAEVEHARLTSLGNFQVGAAADSGEKLQVTGDGVFKSNTNTIVTINSNGGSALLRLTTTVGTQAIRGGLGGTNNMVFETNSTERMRLDASGNLGLGVTPSAWGSTWRAIELEYSNGGQAIASLYPMIIANGYNTGGGFFYKTTSQATYYQQIVGQHRWFNAPSGTAGNAITFTQAMTLDVSGNLGIGITSPTQRLHVSGNALFTGYVESNSGVYFSGNVGSPFIWVRDNYSLRFGTNDTERMRLDANGNLGIGTTTPGNDKLSVVGSGRFTAGLTSSTSFIQYAHYFYNGGGTNDIFASTTGNNAGSGNFAIVNTVGGSRIALLGSATGTVRIGNNTQTAATATSFVVDLATNNVGIGTASPSQKLDVRDGMISVQRNSDSNVVNFNVFSGVTPVSAFQISTDQPNLLSIINGRNSYQLVFSTNDLERMRITSTGNVGIGTTSINASAKLQVDSTTQGFLPPRMTATQRAAISTPAEGLIIFQTDGVVGLYLYVNSAWKSLAIVN